MTDEYKSHWAADLFPLMQEEEFAALVADIKTHGMREPILRIKGDDGESEILDGRNRLRACEAAGVEPHFEQYEGDDPLGAVLSANLHRRHLNESQRALAAAKLQGCANLRKKISQEEAAKIFRVSPRTVTYAVKVLQKGTAFMLAEIEAGRMAVSFAVTEIKDPARSAANYAKKAAEDRTAHRIDAEDADDTNPIEGPQPAGTVVEATEPPPEVDQIKKQRAEKTAETKTAKAEPKTTPKQREEENSKLAPTREATACESRKAREAGDKALAIIAAHMPGDAIESLHPLMREIAQGGGIFQFLAGLATLKPSRQGNGHAGDDPRAELARLKEQIALYQDGDCIVLGDRSPGDIVADLRATLGEERADRLGDVLKGREDFASQWAAGAESDHKEAAE